MHKASTVSVLVCLCDSHLTHTHLREHVLHHCVKGENSVCARFPVCVQGGSVHVYPDTLANMQIVT